MPTMFTGSGIPGKVGSLLPALRPQPAAAFAQPGATQVDKLLLPIAMPSPPDAEISEPRGQDSVNVTAPESDPLQLLALLLAAPGAMPPAEGGLPVPTQNGVQAMNADLLCAEAGNAGLLRNSVLAVGHLTTASPLQVKEQTRPAALVPIRTASGDVLSMLQNVPKKLLTSADALLGSQSVLQRPQADRESLTSNTLHPQAPVLLNALLKGDAEANKLPTIVLPVASEQKAEVLQKALAERLEMQIDRHVQKATIRLDPPNLGKLDISIHFESGKLQVQIQAAQPEVTRLLQQISNEMRASLSEQNNVQVNVQVSTQNGEGRQQHRHRDNPKKGIDNNNEEVTTIHRGTDGTILTMV